MLWDAWLLPSISNAMDTACRHLPRFPNEHAGVFLNALDVLSDVADMLQSTEVASVISGVPLAEVDCTVLQLRGTAVWLRFVYERYYATWEQVPIPENCFVWLGHS